MDFPLQCWIFGAAPCLYQVSPHLLWQKCSCQLSGEFQFPLNTRQNRGLWLKYVKYSHWQHAKNYFLGFWGCWTRIYHELSFRSALKLQKHSPQAPNGSQGGILRELPFQELRPLSFRYKLEVSQRFHIITNSRWFSGPPLQETLISFPCSNCQL